MRAWVSPSVPSLQAFGKAPAVRVHDTVTGELVTSRPDGPARLYVCGITPYDATHLGHAATYVAFDLLNRAWRDAGHEVRYVQNVTDVDDPLLERAAQTGVGWRDLADQEIERFRGDMEALRVLAPDEYVGAVESIPLVIEMTQQLAGLGLAYEVEGDWYYSVRSDAAFGTVSHLAEPEMLTLFGERGGDPDRPGKKDPLDCILWRAERPGEPAWDSVIGPGRPGWHVECSAIALRHLGESFDVQGGGRDLIFPHHEMSAGEAQAAFPGLVFARSYVHTGMVGYQGEKMSKSRGNLVFVSKLRESGVDPTLIRLALLAHHYRADWEWTGNDIEKASSRLESWRAALDNTNTAQAEQLVTTVRAALAHDLDTPRVITLLDDWADGWHRGDGSGADTVRDLLDARLGIRL
ncbi:MAG: L-cysteine:1D-myo-inositol 2-amino-2-deoxy-alpha-D-glucopyranoside ligase [Nocardioidaceae bacterium]|nr:L-cysteine:1D-myo-inositol 2-amino-2-deoxy-alpha-D-glucopyranoside ligase [Nocardioidaceae bacterium]